jgi:hypothetical protein
MNGGFSEVIGKDEDKKIEEDNRRRLAMMRHTLLMAVLTVGVIFSLVSSCATVPTEPLAPGELRFLSLEVPGGLTIRSSTEYQARIRFQAEGKREIKRICLLYSGDGPYCITKWSLDAGIITIWLRADRRGNYRLECYAEYNQEGKIRRTNSVTAPVEFF